MDLDTIEMLKETDPETLLADAALRGLGGVLVRYDSRTRSASAK